MCLISAIYLQTRQSEQDLVSLRYNDESAARKRLQVNDRTAYSCTLHCQPRVAGCWLAYSCTVRCLQAVQLQRQKEANGARRAPPQAVKLSEDDQLKLVEKLNQVPNRRPTDAQPTPNQRRPAALRVPRFRALWMR